MNFCGPFWTVELSEIFIRNQSIIKASVNIASDGAVKKPFSSLLATNVFLATPAVTKQKNMGGRLWKGTRAL